MKNTFYLLLILVTFAIPLKAQKGTNGGSPPHGGYKINWTVNPFDHQIFIENKGQFDTCIPLNPHKGDGGKVLYAVQQGPMFAYFTPHGIVYKYIEHPKRDDDSDNNSGTKEDADLLPPIPPIDHSLSATWQGSNPLVSVEGEDEKADYYVYSTGKKSSINVNIFKKIIYKNLYPDIDVEYIFPTGKEGIKYTVIVHPGGNPALVKLQYTGAKEMYIDSAGNIQINSGWGSFTDYAPSTFYKEDNSTMPCKYNLKDSIESFVLSVPSSQNHNTLMIDPYTTNWTNALPFTTTGAYDVDYDYLGNVWVYGSSGPLQLAKFNAAGTLQWTFNSFSNGYYGDFAVDKFDGNAYCTEGFDGAGAEAQKINTNGVLQGTSPGSSSLEEMWRITFDPCNRVFPVGGGGFSPVQACVLDTSMTGQTPVNPLNAIAGEVTHDVCLITTDPNGNSAYMAVAQSVFEDPTNFINDFFKMTLPTLAPTAYILSDGYNFQEVGSVNYTASVTNGMNGMAASPNWLYTYDGETLKQWNKNTGALNLSNAISGTSYSWGGLDVDYCDNVYAGNSTNIDVYNNTLTLTSTIGPLTGTVYDVVLGSNYTTLYTCGSGFLTSISLTPLSPPVITKTVTSAGCSCTGTATATLTLCGNPVTTGVTYLWSNGQTTQTATNLCAGIDSITITMGCGNVFKDTVKIPGSAGTLTLTTTQTNATCAGLGTATVSVSGGSSPYTYSWSPVVGTNSSVSGLSAGTYTITVTDATGCTNTAVVTISGAGAISVTATNTNENCNGGNSATATASVSGGNSPYTYSWASSGGSNSVATALTIGTYTIYVTDANGCTGSATVNITQPLPISLTTTQVNAVCSTLGSATVSATGGTSPYTYSWSPLAGSNSTISGLSAGTYTVYVTDANGCTNSTSLTITGSGSVSVTTINTNDSCNGGNNATATASVSGGTSPYTYSWSPAAGSNSTISGLTAGNYTITITDANGCIGSAVINITQPLPISLTTTQVNAICSTLGSATVSASGGTSPYTYSWSPIGGTNATASGLNPGTYTVYVNDANGCTNSITVSITGSGTISITTTNTNENCFGGNNATATATVSGGTAPYTYSWSPVAGSNPGISGLTAGTYTITITDANGCTSTASVIITQPPVISASISAIVNELCNGGTTGSATVSVSGGTSPYTYSWAPSGETNSIGTGFSAGTYTVYITDANGCIITDSVIITEPPILVVSVSSSVNVSCNGGTNGSATASASGGVSPYTYSWANIGGTNATGTGFSAGIYTVYVTDANGCTATNSISITQPTPIAATTSTTIATCGNSNGSATVSASGGTSPYTYSWSPTVGTNATISGLSVGTYTVVITDANGCTFSITAIVSQPSSITASITSSTNVLCFGGTNGSATVSANGGFTPYTYSWAPTSQTNSTATGLSAGNYTVITTDSAGCAVTNTITITQPPLLTVSMGAPTNVLCFGGNNGSATVSPGGGTSPYIYSWAPNGGTNATGTGFTAGSYTVYITDANGCSASSTVSITQPPAFTATTTTIDVTCNSGNNGSAAVVVAGGTSPYIYSWSPVSSSNAIITALSAGTYTIVVTDANGCTASATAIVSEPPALTVSTSNTNINCFGDINGSASATPAGGSSPYTYSWSPGGGTTSTISNLSAGTYTITVFDADNCTASAVVTIIQPSSPLLVTASGPASVCSGAPANLTSSVSGGTGPYIYSWAPSGASTDTTTVYPVSNSTYTIFVTDANGCTETASVTIAVDPPLSLVVSGDTTVCIGGTIYLFGQGSGGDGTYFYKWLPSGITNQWVSFILTKDTTITVELTDACGSTMVSKTINILLAPAPDVSFNSNPTIGCYPLCIQFRDFSTITSGTIVAWDWNFGNGDSSLQKNPIYCYNDTGTFTVTLTATSSNGCSSTLRILNMIKVYPHPVASFIYTPDPVNIMNPLVQFTDESTGTYSINQWYWKFGDGSNVNSDQNPSHLYSDTGTYCVHLMIIDIHGCIDSTTKCLDVEPLYTFYIPDAFTPNGDGINDVFQPKGTYIRSYEMYIFDRWGMKLYHTTDFYTGWNGEVNNVGVPCQEDTYVYVIYVFDTEGNKHTYTGRVNLIR